MRRSSRTRPIAQEFSRHPTRGARTGGRAHPAAWTDGDIVPRRIVGSNAGRISSADSRSYMSKQILIINITRMGDLVQMNGLLARLQTEFPGVSVDLVVDIKFAPVVSMLPGLRHIVTYDFHGLIDDTRAMVKDLVDVYRTMADWIKPLLEVGYDRIVNLT